MTVVERFSKEQASFLLFTTTASPTCTFVHACNVPQTHLYLTYRMLLFSLISPKSAFFGGECITHPQPKASKPLELFHYLAVSFTAMDTVWKVAHVYFYSLFSFKLFFLY